MEPWVVEVLCWGYRIPFCTVPSLSKDPIPFPLYSPSSIRGKALNAEVLSLAENGAVELAPLPSPGFYSRLFVVIKASGSWRPIIDLSGVESAHPQDFTQDGDSSVCPSIGAEGDWMVSLDLKDAYLQVPVHLDSRKCLRFVAFGRVYQFRLCALVSPRLLNFSRESWLRYLLFCIVRAFGFIST